MSNNCRAGGGELLEVIDFGKQPLGNGFISQDEIANEYFFDMKVGFNETSCMLQLIDQPEPGKMFHENYAFFSSTSKAMGNHFKSWSDSLKSKNNLQNPFIIEIGCNDGIFLENFVGTSFKSLGIEPSLNVANIARNKGIEVENKFITEKTAKDVVLKYGNADYITAANVICHIPDILGLAKSIEILLNRKGVFIFEEPYLGDIIKKCSYDQIYDEHVFLFSCLSVQKLFEKVGLNLIRAEHQTTHGGSMRYTIGRAGEHQIHESVENYISEEISLGLHLNQTMLDLGKRIQKSKQDLVVLLEELKAKKKRICGYAATSKSTTILNFCNIGINFIDCIYDTTPLKQGKLSPGMHIPIVKWENFSKEWPDYTFLFAWNHLEEIMKKEMDYTKSGRKWITHIPEVTVS